MQLSVLTYQSCRLKDECIPLNMNTVCIIAHICYIVYDFQGSWYGVVGIGTGLYN